MTSSPTLPSSPTSPAGIPIQAADGSVFQVPPRLASFLPESNGAPIVLAVSTASLRFALSTLSPYPTLLPPLEESFLQDMITLAEHGMHVPLEYVAGKIMDRDPMSGFVLETVLGTLRPPADDQGSVSDAPPCSEPRTPGLEASDFHRQFDSYFEGYEGDISDLDPWLRSTLTKHAPQVVSQLEAYFSNLEVDERDHKLTLGWDGDDGEGFGFGYGYGSRQDGFGYRGRSGYGSGSGPYGSGLESGGIVGKLERLDGAGYEGRYHSARWG